MKEGFIKVIKSGVLYIWLGFILAIWYKALLFRCINDVPRTLSTIILVGIMLFCCVLGFLNHKILMHREIRTKNALADLLISFGIYTVITYYQICTVFIITVFLISLVLAVLRTISIYSRKIDKKRVSKMILRKRLIRLIDGLKAISCIALTFTMVYFSINIFFGTSLVKANVDPAKQNEVETQTIANNYETLCLLEDNTWVNLTLEERLGVLQTIANIEQRYLGISHELIVGTKTLDEGTLGCYNESEHLILISVDCLVNDSSYKAVEIICHEARHAYQYCMISAFESMDDKYRNLLAFRDVQSYEMEFSNYIDGENDYYGYISQKCESDAYLYGIIAADDYFQRIYEYLEST